MSVFTPGSNRALVYEALESTPKSIETICTETGIAEGPVTSVINQITALGYAKLHKSLSVDGAKFYTKGRGTKPVKTKAPPIAPQVVEYLSKRMGKRVTVAAIMDACNIKSRSPLYNLLDNLTKKGQLSIVDNTNPKQWLVMKNIGLNSHYKAPPTEETEQIQQALFPASTAPLQTSAAISHLMQTEQQNIMYRSAIQQLIVMYEQMGNILEMLGVLEDD
jgi:hypothetical protein